GVATVLQLFDYKAKHVLKVAGLHVTSGVLRTSKNHIFRVKREASKVPAPEGADPLVLDEQGYVTILEESAEAHLKRFKDTVDEVKSGLECGFSIDDYSNFMSGDIIECCKVENKFKSLVVQKYTQEMQYGRQMREGGLAEGGDSDGDNDT
ncbi:infB, partial [Symbiodinium microadriaticum]